jgi:hypothetical protein
VIAGISNRRDDAAYHEGLLPRKHLWTLSTKSGRTSNSAIIGPTTSLITSAGLPTDQPLLGRTSDSATIGPTTSLFPSAQLPDDQPLLYSLIMSRPL